MNLQYRIELLAKLGEYMLSAAGDEAANEWQQAKEKAARENGWFNPEFVELSVKTIAGSFLQKDILQKWTASYKLPPVNSAPKKVGIVMAGNIPLVGFHDLLCVFISGHIAVIKPSSKDETLIRHLAEKLTQWDEELKDYILFADIPKNCDAYIATGSNNSAGYFEYYFKNYPHIIRRNKTSVAILTAEESTEDLVKLADDVYLYFGRGCRNVTKIYVPKNYDFIPLLRAFDKYNYLSDHHKYKNNYDYNLAILLLNKKFYMSNPSLLLSEEASLFSPISQVNYEFYTDLSSLKDSLKENNDIQCIAGKEFVPFGQTQHPGISDYADGADTLQFLANL
jgi:hypothetical protein